LIVNDKQKEKSTFIMTSFYYALCREDDIMYYVISSFRMRNNSVYLLYLLGWYFHYLKKRKLPR